MKVRDRGWALLVTLFVVLFVMTAAMFVAATLRLETEQLLRETRRVHVTALLDAGMAQALSQLWSDPDYGGTATPEPLGGGTFEIEALKIDGLTIEVTVHAAWGSVRRGVRAVVRVDRGSSPKPPRVVRWEPVV